MFITIFKIPRVVLFGHLEKLKWKKVSIWAGGKNFKCIRQDIMVFIYTVIISFSTHDEHLRRALVTHML